MSYNAAVSVWQRLGRWRDWVLKRLGRRRLTDEQDPLRIEKEIGRRTRAENAVEVGLCERCFQHLGKGFNQLERPYVWEEPST